MTGHRAHRGHHIPYKRLHEDSIGVYVEHGVPDVPGFHKHKCGNALSRGHRRAKTAISADFGSETTPISWSTFVDISPESGVFR